MKSICQLQLCILFISDINLLIKYEFTNKIQIFIKLKTEYIILPTCLHSSTTHFIIHLVLYFKRPLTCYYLVISRCCSIFDFSMLIIFLHLLPTANESRLCGFFHRIKSISTKSIVP